jgi:hypothetical protein
MPETVTITPLKTLFKFPLQGPNWRNNFIIGAALTLANSIVPLVPMIFVYGYALQIMRRTIEGQDLELPSWDDWGKLAVDGLRMMLVGLVYLLPGILVLLGGFTLYFASIFSWPLLATTAERGSNGPTALLLSISFLGSIAIMMLSTLLGSLLTLLGLIPLPVVTAHFAVRDKVAAAFRVREWWPLLRANKLGYFAAWVVVLGLMSILYFAFAMAYYTLVLCCLIPLLAAPVSFYVTLIGAVLFGQTYRESMAMLETAESASAG